MVYFPKSFASLKYLVRRKIKAPKDSGIMQIQIRYASPFIPKRLRIDEAR